MSGDPGIMNFSHNYHQLPIPVHATSHSKFTAVSFHVMGMEKIPVIPSLVQSCRQEFETLASRLEHGDTGQGTNAKSHFARFKLWAGSVGAHRVSGMRSLTYRLRDASTIRTQVISLLEDVKRHINEGISNSRSMFYSPNHQRIIRDWVTDKPIALSCPESPNAAHHRQYGDHVDSELAKLLGETEPCTSDESPHITAIKTCLAQAGQAIDCLLRLSIAISNPAPHDQFKSRVNVQTIHYEPYDFKHVQEKFPKLDASKAMRLSKAQTQRRRYFKYREDHHRRLGEGLEPDIAGYTESEAGGTTEASPVPKHLHDSYNHRSDSEQDATSEGSATSFAWSTELGDSAVCVPPIPTRDDDDGPFMCPFCFMIISVESKHDWKQVHPSLMMFIEYLVELTPMSTHRKHVFGDLRPYVCVWDTCASPGQDFQQRKDWIRHMDQEHWRHWSCPVGCSTTFDDFRALHIHLKRSHELEHSPDTMYAEFGMSSRVDHGKAEGICPLCQDFTIKTVRQYRSHVGHHLEQLALFALPNTLEYDGIDHKREEMKGKEKEEREKDHVEGENESTRSKEALTTSINDPSRPVKWHNEDISSDSDSPVEADIDEERPQQLLKNTVENYNERISQQPTGMQQELQLDYAEEPSTEQVSSNENEEINSSLPERAEASQPQRNQQGRPSRAKWPKSRGSQSTRSARISNKQPNRRHKYVQEKKWLCAWCHFGPLDWTYDKECVECGRPRDQYCRIEYQTRRIRVT